MPREAPLEPKSVLLKHLSDEVLNAIRRGTANVQRALAALGGLTGVLTEDKMPAAGPSGTLVDTRVTVQADGTISIGAETGDNNQPLRVQGLYLDGAEVRKQHVVYGNYTIALNDSMILVDTSAASGNITLTLPDCSDAAGMRFRILDVGMNASTYSITVARAGSDLFTANETSMLITTNGDGLSIESIPDSAGTYTWYSEKVYYGQP
jgi:hypothetical protein